MPINNINMTANTIKTDMIILNVSQASLKTLSVAFDLQQSVHSLNSYILLS